MDEIGSGGKNTSWMEDQRHLIIIIMEDGMKDGNEGGMKDGMEMEWRWNV